MIQSLSIIVPYRPDGGWRDRAWDRVVSPALSRLVEEWPADAELLIVEPPPTGPGTPADFNHPLAINRGANAARCDLLMICDADCLPDEDYARLAEHAIRAGAQWARPRHYRKLTRAWTENLLAGARHDHAAAAGYEWIGDSVSWAGCPIYPRGAFDDVGGYDERIAWWGGDDICMGVSMTALYGPSALLSGVTHYWHPDPPEHNYGHERHAEQWTLVERYLAAAAAPDPVRAIRGVRDES